MTAGIIVAGYTGALVGNVPRSYVALDNTGAQFAEEEKVLLTCLFLFTYVVVSTQWVSNSDGCGLEQISSLMVVKAMKEFSCFNEICLGSVAAPEHWPYIAQL